MPLTDEEKDRNARDGNYCIFVRNNFIRDPKRHYQHAFHKRNLAKKLNGIPTNNKEYYCEVCKFFCEELL